jgi:acetylornithine deacetylase
MRMGRVLSRLELLDRRLQAGESHELLGHPSLHASLIVGGEELSSYPAKASLTIERRTLPGEPAQVALAELQAILEELRSADPEFDAEARMVFGRGGYEIAPTDPLPAALTRAASRIGHTPSRVGMTFWTDAAILGEAGIPTVLFGPGGAGLHSVEEYVRIDEVCRCRDALAELAFEFR